MMIRLQCLSKRHVQKWQPTLVTQVDPILQNLREFKVLVTIGLNCLSSCTPLSWYTAHGIAPSKLNLINLVLTQGQK